MPMNEVVLENFWTNESDVESVLMGAYAALESDDCILRMSAWGEMRSDNIVQNDQSNSSDEDLIQFINENINSQNTLTTYLCFYKAINYANTVLHYAPEVRKIDPNYHASELRANQAEAIAIRSLSYWYLLRAFRDVPFTTIPSIDDTHDFFIGKTPFNEVLDSLINDLERVKDYPPVRYTDDESKAVTNTARFTRLSIRALLADMYLWKGDWDKCIACCDYITTAKYEEYKEIKSKKGPNCTIEIVNNKYPLINEIFRDKNGNQVCGNAYNEIFATGGSFETLFELPFDRSHENGFVSKYYNDQNSSMGLLKAGTKIERDGSEDGFSPYDVRYYQNIMGTGSDKGIFKYVYEKMSYDMSQAKALSEVGSKRSNKYSNWIVYRYTDVLLMEAEAKTQLAVLETGADSLNSLKEAFELVDAVNRRAICCMSKDNPVYKNATTLSESDYLSVTAMEKLVMQERRRELMFEGKRWFDLVRKAMREGNAESVANTVGGKSSNYNSQTVGVKFKNLNGLFLPFNRDEIKINDNLVQNPAYSQQDEHIKKAK